MRWVLAGLDEPTQRKIAKVRRRVRRHVWMLLHLRPGGFLRLTVVRRYLKGWIAVGLDATVITSVSRNEGAAGTFEGTRWNRARATRGRTPPTAGISRANRRTDQRPNPDDESRLIRTRRVAEKLLGSGFPPRPNFVEHGVRNP
jgi:hypothetical protein